MLIEWDGGSVGGGNGGGGGGGGNNGGGGGGNGGGDGSTVARSGGRALESTAGRYGYSPLEKVRSEEGSQNGKSRSLQTATTLKVEFIDCKFTVRTY